MMASFYYHDKGPSGFCCLLQIRAFCYLNLTGATKFKYERKNEKNANGLFLLSAFQFFESWNFCLCTQINSQKTAVVSMSFISRSLGSVHTCRFFYSRNIFLIQRGKDSV